MNEPIDRAEDLQLEACLSEVSGAGPADDLAERTLAALGAPAHELSDADEASSRPRWWLAAGLALFGLGVVAAVSLLQEREASQGAAAQQEEVSEPDAQNPQDPEPPQDPEKKKLDLEIARMIRDLELAPRRTGAIRGLLEIGVPAAPALRHALEVEKHRGRTEVIAALQRTLFHLSVADAKKAAGLAPDEQVTLVADYSDNRLLVVSPEGKFVRTIEQIYGAWDVELLPSGNLLVTEFSVSRVAEIDPKGKIVWSFEDLRNPYDADRLPNGNTLIGDTFRGRVIEVTPEGKIAWSFDKGIRPFDVERLPDGNTLIADVLKDRVLEVSREGKVVWEVGNMPSIHDADRLPDGNTLIVLRTLNRVIEVDRDGKEVFRLENLNAPSDADRLPNGNTLVAENNRVREFDPAGKQVWAVQTTWAVEVNRY